MSHFGNTMNTSSPQPLAVGQIAGTVREGRDRQSDEKGKMNLRERRGGGRYWRAGEKRKLETKRTRQTRALTQACTPTLQTNNSTSTWLYTPNQYSSFFFFLPPPLPRANQTAVRSLGKQAAATGVPRGCRRGHPTEFLTVQI